MVSSAKQIKKFLQGAFTIVIVLFEKKQSSGDSLCGFHFQVTAEPSSRTLPLLSTSSSCRISAFFSVATAISEQNSRWMHGHFLRNYLRHLLRPTFFDALFNFSLFEMVTLQSARPLVRMYEYRPLISPSLGRLKPANVAVNNAIGPERSCGGWRFCCDAVTTSFLQPFKAATSNCSAIHGKGCHDYETSSGGKSTNIVWHDCPIGKPQREKLIQQKGCVIWITGLSGSGKSTLACALSQGLHSRRKLTYILDGDNIRHGLNSDLSFEPADRAENIRRIGGCPFLSHENFSLTFFVTRWYTGEVASLFADAGIICIASLISPFRKDRDACRALLAEGDFIEVFLDVPLNICEARDPKGLYKLCRAGKIQGFTGIDDPYEEPLNSEIVLQYKEGICSSAIDMAERVISYLEERGYLQA